MTKTTEQYFIILSVPCDLNTYSTLVIWYIIYAVLEDLLALTVLHADMADARVEGNYLGLFVLEIVFEV